MKKLALLLVFCTALSAEITIVQDTTYYRRSIITNENVYPSTNNSGRIGSPTRNYDAAWIDTIHCEVLNSNSTGEGEWEYLWNAVDYYLWGGSYSPEGGYIQFGVWDWGELTIGCGAMPYLINGKKIQVHDLILYYEIGEGELPLTMGENGGGHGEISLDSIMFQSLDLTTGVWTTERSWTTGTSDKGFGSIDCITVPYTVVDVKNYRIKACLTVVSGYPYCRIYGVKMRFSLE